MASRKTNFKKMSSLMGNAAAHRAVYGEDAFTLLEATRYQAEAEEIASIRTLNEEELARLMERTKRTARNIIKRRKEHWGDQRYIPLCSIADDAIEKFIRKIREQEQS
jgi:hypothetical protein